MMCSNRSVNKSVVLVLLLTFSRMHMCDDRGEFPFETQFSQELQEDGASQNIVGPFVHHRPRPPNHHPPPFLYAGSPRRLAAYAVPRPGSNHELQLNVTWLPSIGARARDYSLEISSLTNTEDCNTSMCYEYNIPGDTIWYLVPSVSSPVTETCAVRPGCSYRVRLIAHPWDGHTAASTVVQLDECVSGVCSCAHAPLLQAPAVSATIVSVEGEVLANVSWSLPPPDHPQRLPRGLKKAYYVVSIGKQMVSDAHPSPWFSNIVSRKIDTSGSVFTGDTAQWNCVPIVERSGKRGEKKNALDVRLLARVYLVDDRGCAGPAGNATAYDPAMANTEPFRAYLIWAVFGGLCVLAVLTILAVSTRVIKRALKAVRSSPLSAQCAPLEPVRQGWLPMQVRTWRSYFHGRYLERLPI